MLLDVGRNQLIGSELHDETGASARDGTEGGGVTGEALQRHFRNEFLVAVLALAADNHASAALQVAHHVAHLVAGHEHFHIVDGFEQLGTSGLEGVGECVTACQHEREFVGVNRVHLAVIDHHADIAGIRPCEWALLHAAHDALEDGRHEAGVDGSAHHRVDEHEFSTPFEVDFLFALGVNLKLLVAKLVGGGVGHAVVVWFHDEVNLAELACTARLLLVAIVGTSSLRDGLAIWNLGLFEANLDFLVVFHAPFQGAQVELALTLHEGLLQFLRLFQNPGRVFLRHLLDGGHHLLGVALVLGLDGTDVLGVRIFDEVEAVFTVLAGQRVASAHVFQLHGAADVACHQFFHLDAVGSGTSENLCDALFRATVGVGQIVAFVHLARHHLEVLHTTDVWLVGSLEEVE